MAPVVEEIYSVMIIILTTSLGPRCLQILRNTKIKMYGGQLKAFFSCQLILEKFNIIVHFTDAPQPLLSSFPFFIVISDAEE